MSKKKPHNAGDEAAVAAAQEAMKSEHELLLVDLKEVLKSPSGVRYFAALLARGKLYHTTFTGNSHGQFAEGRRDFALSILADLQQAASRETLAAILLPEVKEEEN